MMLSIPNTISKKVKVKSATQALGFKNTSMDYKLNFIGCTGLIHFSYSTALFFSIAYKGIVKSISVSFCEQYGHANCFALIHGFGMQFL